MDNKETDSKIPIYKLTSKEKVLDYYDKWANKAQFNQDMIDWNYTAPSNTVHLLDQYIDNKNAIILDAGCGTGLAGIELKNKGYVNIHGVDFSQRMLNLIPHGIYQITELIDLNHPLKFEKDTFDAITCVGTFTYGHVKAHALYEFVRIVKKQGLICFTINEGIYKEYKFDKMMDELSKNNLWKIIEFAKSSYIVNKDIEAWLCIAKKI